MHMRNHGKIPIVPEAVASCIGRRIFRQSLLCAALTAFVASPSLAEIGRIKSSNGAAGVQRGAEHLAAQTALELLPGDWLETGKDGHISLTFVDNTRFAVGPD